MRSNKDTQWAALLASAAVIGGFTLYWIIQIQAVREMLALAYGARGALQRRQAWMRAIATRAKPILGVAFVLVGLSLWFGWFRIIEFWAIETLPYWFQDLSILI